MNEPPDPIPAEMGDVSDVFDFDLPTLDYNDRPLGGWLQHKVTGSWYAFFCDEIIAGLLAHWTLVRAEKGDSTEDAYDALARASQDENGVWLSIVADGRVGPHRCTTATISNRASRPTSPRSFGR